MSPLSQPLITLLSSLTARSETAPCLRAAGVVITDGAWGTQLQARGLPPGTCPDTWNLSHPDLVEQVPRAYVEAGSRIVLTNTFRANRLALADHGVTDSVEAINRAGVEISRRATGGRALVVETMADLDEARIAVVAAKATGLPVVACMVFDSGADQDRTMMGTTPEDAARALEAAGADVIGANCGQGIEGYVGICRRLVNATDRPVWIKANAGVPTLVDGEAVYATSPAQFASASRAVVDAGARFIGGCCGTTPEFIRALAREIGS